MLPENSDRLGLRALGIDALTLAQHWEQIETTEQWVLRGETGFLRRRPDDRSREHSNWLLLMVQKSSRSVYDNRPGPLTSDLWTPPGCRWERRAERFLRGHGLTTIARNFSAKCGEIDLVMRDRDHVAFIEVRYRGRSRFGNAASSVTLKKQQKIVRCAQLFLQSFPNGRTILAGMM